MAEINLLKYKNQHSKKHNTNEISFQTLPSQSVHIL